MKTVLITTERGEIVNARVCKDEEEAIFRFMLENEAYGREATDEEVSEGMVELEDGVVIQIAWAAEEGEEDIDPADGTVATVPEKKEFYVMDLEKGQVGKTADGRFYRALGEYEYSDELGIKVQTKNLEKLLETPCEIVATVRCPKIDERFYFDRLATTGKTKMWIFRFKDGRRFAIREALGCLTFPFDKSTTGTEIIARASFSADKLVTQTYKTHGMCISLDTRRSRSVVMRTYRDDARFDVVFSVEAISNSIMGQPIIGDTR